MSTDDTATTIENKEDAELEGSRPQKKYNTDAEVALLALSGQPRILDLDDVWREEVESLELKNFLVEDLLVTMVYYTHGVEGIRKLQTQRPEPDKRLSYHIQMVEIPDQQDSTTKLVRAHKVRDRVQIQVIERPNEPHAGNGHCKMWIGFKILPGGTWKANICDAGWTIRSSTKAHHLDFVSAFVGMSLINMIISIRRKDGGESEEKYFAELVA